MTEKKGGTGIVEPHARPDSGVMPLLNQGRLRLSRDMRRPEFQGERCVHVNARIWTGR